MIHNSQPVVAFATLGCKVNTYDTETMTALFEQANYRIGHFNELADVYVVNTCTVTHLAGRKSRNMLRRAKKRNPKAIVVAVGCYVQVASKELEALKEVDILIGTGNRNRILDYIETFKQKGQQANYVLQEESSTDLKELSITETTGRTRAFLKIQEGCNQYCTYCIIPYARGGLKSRTPDRVLQEVIGLREKGYREIVLTGIHLASYGYETGNKHALIELIETLDRNTDIDRIRLGSLDPRMMTETFFERLTKVDSFCPHFHLSLQSGSDTVLKRMGRHYTPQAYQGIVEMSRRAFPMAAITTDILVGFPGETEEEFQETLAFVETIGFYQIHVFKYSPRQGTKAASMPNQVAEEIKNRRSQTLIALGKKLEDAFLKQHHGRVEEVLIEKEENGKFLGHTANYIPVVIENNEDIKGKLFKFELLYNRNALEMKGIKP